MGASQTKERPLRVGEVIADRFEIVKVLGAGGFASVYEARQLNIDRACAIKVLRPILGADEQEMRARFHRELHEDIRGIVADARQHQYSF